MPRFSRAGCVAKHLPELSLEVYRSVIGASLGVHESGSRYESCRERENSMPIEDRISDGIAIQILNLTKPGECETERTRSRSTTPSSTEASPTSPRERTATFQ